MFILLKLHFHKKSKETVQPEMSEEQCYASVYHFQITVVESTKNLLTGLTLLKLHLFF